jgi:hypothetical protein
MPNQYVLFELEAALEPLVAAVKTGALLLTGGLVLITCGLLLIGAAVRFICWSRSVIRGPADSVFASASHGPALHVLLRKESPLAGIVRPGLAARKRR